MEATCTKCGESLIKHDCPQYEQSVIVFLDKKNTEYGTTQVTGSVTVRGSSELVARSVALILAAGSGK